MSIKRFRVVLIIFILSITSHLLAMSNFFQVEPSSVSNQPKMCLGEGEIGYVKGSPALPNLPCCSGFKNRDTLEGCPKKCKQACGGRVDGEIVAFVCIACGDKKCDPRNESHCNCPEDCK